MASGLARAALTENRFALEASALPSRARCWLSLSRRCVSPAQSAESGGPEAGDRQRLLMAVQRRWSRGAGWQQCVASGTLSPWWSASWVDRTLMSWTPRFEIDPQWSSISLVWPPGSRPLNFAGRSLRNGSERRKAQPVSEFATVDPQAERSWPFRSLASDSSASRARAAPNCAGVPPPGKRLPCGHTRPGTVSASGTRTLEVAISACRRSSAGSSSRLSGLECLPPAPTPGRPMADRREDCVRTSAAPVRTIRPRRSCRTQGD